MRRILPLLASAAFAAACCSIPAPEPVLPVPSPEQIAWHKKEAYVLACYGVNTFNDLEWSFGDVPPSTFAPTAQNCRQWTDLFRRAGLTGVVLTAKHHDGFCLWPTSTTDYNITHSPCGGDVLKELSEACAASGIDFGVYLSPWDRNNKDYAFPEYVDNVYHNQIRELISNYGPLFEFWFDGANGGDGYYGGACEKRAIDASTYYKFDIAREMIKEKHPDAMIFGSTVPDICWIGNEDGWADCTLWCSRNAADPVWCGWEVDVSVRPGWYYHASEDDRVKTPDELVEIFYNSIGRGANLILGVPIDPRGCVHPVDSARMLQAAEIIRSDLSANLLGSASVRASTVRGRAFSAGKAVDGDWDTYWATPDGVSQGEITFTFKNPVSLNRFLIQEYIPLGQRVSAFSIEYRDGDSWKSVDSTEKELTTIGYKRIVRFNTVEAAEWRIRFPDSRGPLCINNIEAFCAPTR